ncbi:MAG: succinyl-diaminopimelate desuccinylase [Gammaproteobacteria bacterium]|nr:succinyl-diaminopimelate desuccinylase [Gammaproteobacteria bacterium]
MIDPDALRRRIAGKRDDVVELTRSLIRFPTVNPPGEGYEECARHLGDRLARRGFEVVYERAEGAVGDTDRHPRWNVVARREGPRAGPTVHFNGHIDVVAAGSGWTVDPFAAEEIDGRIYGRGSCDMKGGIAAAVVAVEALLEIAPDLPGAIEISGTADEESGGYGGVAYLAERGYFSRPRVDHVIIPEPLNKDRVCLGHRGVWWAELETFGRQAHGSMPFLGDSAIRHMGAVLAAFETELFPRLAAKRTDMPVVPDGARASTLNINSIHGGEAEGYDGLPAPLVADACRLILDRRFLIEERLDTVKAEVRDLLERLAREREGFRYRLTDLFEVVPSMTPAEDPVARAVARAVEQVLTRPAEFVVSPGTYDQKHIDRIGRLPSCVAYGPGILDLAHQPDEYVAVDDLVDAAQVMGLAALGLLTGAAA